MLSNSSNGSNGQNINNSNSSRASSRETIDVNLSEYLVKLKRRWKPALAIFLLTMGVTGGLSLLQKETYQAEGKILFKPKVNSTESQEENKARSFTSNQTPLITQQQIISSVPVLQKTIEILKLKDNQGSLLTPSKFKQKLEIL